MAGIGCILCDRFPFSAHPFFVWQDARKNFHIIAHSQGNINVCGGGRLPGGGCSVHLFSDSIKG
jgi:hypothetical protein